MGLLLDDVPKAVVAALLLGSALLVLLTARARRRGRVHGRWSLGARPRRWLLIIVVAATFTSVAEDVLGAEQQEWILRLDRWARVTVRTGLDAHARATAAAISHLTGEGLVLFVAGIAAGLALARQARDTVLLLGVTLGAWVLTGILKLAFAVPRPRNAHALWELHRFGFPSGHTFVSMVACGMVAWVLGRGASDTVRAWLYAGALVVAAGAGSARVILDKHWLSDVIGGLALGALCVSVVTLVEARRLDRARAASPPPTS
jgi:undecaprenyl-diphosphatase